MAQSGNANATGRSSGKLKHRKIEGVFIPHRAEMTASAAWRVLSLSARRFLDALEIELCNNAGRENGRLIVTHADLKNRGLDAHAIAPAIRETVALGLVEVTEHGRAANGDFRSPSRLPAYFWWPGNARVTGSRKMQPDTAHIRGRAPTVQAAVSNKTKTLLFGDGRKVAARRLLQRESNGAGRENYNRYLLSDRHNSISQYPYEQHKDHWLRFVIHQLLIDCRESADLTKNHINFITFNYDNSLEVRLEQSLRAIDFLEPDHIKSFMSGNRFVHMYGRLTPGAVAEDFTKIDLGFASDARLDHLTKANTVLDAWWTASQNLRVIDPHTKEDDGTAMMAKTVIDGAKRCYFLGFGFDKNNLSRLGFPMKNPPLTYFTNYLGSKTVSKRAARALGTDAESSERDAYEAIELDFGQFGD